MSVLGGRQLLQYAVRSSHFPFNQSAASFKLKQNFNTVLNSNSHKSTAQMSTMGASANTASSVAQPVLYSYWHSSCAFRVRIALNFKEIPYDMKTIDIFKAAELLSDEYRKVNPMAQVPALQIDGHTLIESLAIMHYLEETRPQRALLPQDAYKRAKVREICETICSGIQPLQNTATLVRVGEEKKKEWLQYWITRGFSAIEKMLSVSAGKYCVGDEITMADCCLVPQVFNARRYRIDVSPYSTILRIDRELESHAAFRAANPFNQPDCPKKKK